MLRRHARGRPPPWTWMMVAPAAGLSRSLRSLPLASLGDIPAVWRDALPKSSRGGDCDHPLSARRERNNVQRSLGRDAAAGSATAALSGATWALVDRPAAGGSRCRPATARGPRPASSLLAPEEVATTARVLNEQDARNVVHVEHEPHITRQPTPLRGPRFTSFIRPRGPHISRQSESPGGRRRDDETRRARFTKGTGFSPKAGLACGCANPERCVGRVRRARS
jgi:hypothetical protein